ncbi:MAG TPA: DcaP family trimeric outer membrane transporter [Puia sp.]|nr:DcaP family trimeric outer membrane transporter [Puia sp.]
MKLRLLLLTILLIIVSCSYAQTNDTTKVRNLEVYGFVMTDMGYNFDQINPNWFDALRITKLPSYKNQYGTNGNVFFSVRQSRFGVRGWTPTPIGELKTVFEFDLFGVGVDEGQTTIRPRNFYGEIGGLLVGQANSPFMDGDIWPNTMEYWGPTGMVFFRNIQIRYALMQGDNELFVALERPGASADQGSYEGRIELDSVRGRLNVPDFSAHFKKTFNWGHVQLAGMLRSIKWEDIHTTGGYNVTGSVVGWGLNLSTVINLGKMDVFRGSFIYGEGVENYMQDCPYDIGVVENPGNAQTPFTGKALPITGIVAFLDHNWTPKLSTSIGYSSAYVDNTSATSPSTYKMGQYAIANIVFTPFKNALMAGELQWGRRTNFSDGFSSNATKIMFSFKYSFSQVFYRKKS